LVKHIVTSIAAGLLCTAIFAANGAWAQTAPKPVAGVFTSLGDVPDRTGSSAGVDQNYRLGPLDKISVNVFGLEKLSVEKVQVDASGVIVLPLIGAVKVGGRTAEEVSTEVANRLGEKYLESPNVTVSIEEAVSQRVTVTGAVIESGIYALRGPTSLLQAVSLAKGPDAKVADLRQVAVFRVIKGEREIAIFDLDAIRRGTKPDPEILGGDTVVVPASNSKNVWNQIIGALPAFGVFTLFR
jgi:polysaccharide export outer membrane protein